MPASRRPRRPQVVAVVHQVVHGCAEGDALCNRSLLSACAIAAVKEARVSHVYLEHTHAQKLTCLSLSLFALIFSHPLTFINFCDKLNCNAGADGALMLRPQVLL